MSEKFICKTSCIATESMYRVFPKTVNLFKNDITPSVMEETFLSLLWL